MRAVNHVWAFQPAWSSSCWCVVFRVLFLNTSHVQRCSYHPWNKKKMVDKDTSSRLEAYLRFFRIWDHLACVGISTRTLDGSVTTGPYADAIVPYRPTAVAVMSIASSSVAATANLCPAPKAWQDVSQPRKQPIRNKHRCPEFQVHLKQSVDPLFPSV